MKNKWFMLALIMLTLVNLSALGTFAYKRWCHAKRRGAVEHLPYLKRQLGLSEEQAAQIKNFQERFQPKVETLLRTLRENRAELVRELMKTSPDAARIEQLLQRMDTAQAALQREVVNNLLLEKEILTPAQQEKFFSFVLERFSLKDKKPNVKR